MVEQLATLVFKLVLMTREMNRLTQEQADGLTRKGWYGDGGGLYLRVQKGGTKSWVFVDCKGGRRKEKGLGPIRLVTLAEARVFRDRLARKANRDQVVKGLPRTFGEIADEFMDEREAIWRNPVHRQQWRTTLTTQAAALQDKLPGEITPDDVLSVIKPLWLTTNETASRLRGRIERILDAAKARGHISAPWENPARWQGHLEHLLPPYRPAKRHHAAAPWEEMPKLWHELTSRERTTRNLALQFLILTAARAGEVVGARWTEIDFKTSTWTIPAARMKAGIEHSVPLPGAAIEILGSIFRVSPNDHIFCRLLSRQDNIRPWRILPSKPLTHYDLLAALRTDLKRTETVHGFRSSFRDFAGEATEYPRELAEMALAHAVGDAVEQAYRRGRAVERRRPMMEDWAAFLATTPST